MKNGSWSSDAVCQFLGGLAVQQVDFTTRIAEASTRNRTYLERPGLLRPQQMHDENVSDTWNPPQGSNQKS